MRRSVQAIIGSAVLAACAAPSAEEVVTPGPLGPSYNRIVSCAPPEVTQEWFGARTLGNGGSADVVVDGVTLPGSRDVEIVKAVLVPDVIPGGRFFVDPKPATAFPRGERETWPWHRRIPAAGARIPPGTSFELMLLLRRTARVGRFDGVNVDYHDADHRYRRTEDRAGMIGVLPRECH